MDQAHTLAAEVHCQSNGEERIGLRHQRGKARRDVTIDGDVQKPKLPHADKQPISDQIAPRHVGTWDEKHRRNERKGEPQGRELQRRQMIEARFDDDKVNTPHRHHQQRE